jgi:hypothetical protein
MNKITAHNYKAIVSPGIKYYIKVYRKTFVKKVTLWRYDGIEAPLDH